MKLQPVITKAKRGRFVVIETKRGIAVKKDDNIYEFHPLMLLLSDRSKLYSSKQNDAYPLYYPHERVAKYMICEEKAMKFWLPYKPKQRITGEIINNKFYDSKRVSKLKKFSGLFEVFRSK